VLLPSEMSVNPAVSQAVSLYFCHPVVHIVFNVFLWLSTQQIIKLILKVLILWHVDQMLGNDRKRSSYTTAVICTATIGNSSRKRVSCAVNAEIL
jgi:hypothetical protein